MPFDHRRRSARFDKPIPRISHIVTIRLSARPEADDLISPRHFSSV
jgi:hypothetical protein